MYRWNPKITKIGKNILADNQPISQAWDKIADENLLIVTLPPFLFYKGSRILWFFESPEGREHFINILKDSNSKERLPIFALRRPLGQRRGTIEMFWSVKNSRYLVGAVQFIANPDNNDLILTHMAVRPKYRRHKINTFMINEIRKTFPDRKLYFHELTEQGRAFMVQYGGEEWRDA